MKHSLVLCLLMMLPVPVAAQNIDLVTLPKRNTVQLTIYNSEDITLAKETRFVTLKKGANRLQFSWAGTLIDPTSVVIRPLEHQGEIDVVDTIYPGQKPQHLIWNISSDVEGQVPMEVSYFTSGLTWQMDYVAISNDEETRLDFRGYVRVFNNSGEEYENAEIRMIVGKINLVQKIADLAKQQGVPTPQAQTAKFQKMKQRAFSGAIQLSGGFGGGGARPKEIVKEGVSEYFMFSVDGQETIRNGWSKRMRAVNAADVEFEIVYRLRAYQYGARPVRFFIWSNDEQHHLGDSPLPDGVVRVFRTNGRDGLSFLGQQKLNYVPVKAKIEVNLGTDDLVVYRRRKSDSSRFNFVFDTNKNVNGWDEAQQWHDSIRNFHDKPIQFELRLQFPGDVELKSNAEVKLFDYRTVESVFSIAASGKHSLVYTATTHHGKNAKQNRVRISP